MTDIDDLVARVAARAASDSDELPARIDAAQLEEAERRLGFALHPLLARIYRDVADGGFGPDYQLLPLLGEKESVVGEYVANREGASDDLPWPEGVVPILNWGCGMYAAVDCQDPAGQVLLFEPNAYVWGRGVECWFLDAGSFAEWLENWLSGNGWFEEDAYAATSPGPVSEPVPWEHAEARLP
ncbi:MAG TPA: SMI1/KNR4 family protein [Actinospica sp.]|nr:SMI1/KNR4 family protein [Actinospica sp.]